MRTLVRLMDTPWGRARLVDLKSVDWLQRAPYTVRVLAENIVRSLGEDGGERALEALRDWRRGSRAEIPFYPARVVSQDLTGVALALDLALLREAVAARGLDPGLVDPSVRVDLIVD
ncbi:MAG: aconitate hydratase, partial [Acidilobaceae archaeon]